MGYRDQLAASAAPQLQPGETVQVAFQGRGRGRPGGNTPWPSVLGLLLGATHQRVVIATERHVYVFPGSLSSSTEVGPLEARYPLADAPIEVGKASARIGDEPMQVALSARGQLSKLAELLAGARSAAAGAQPPGT